MKNQFTTIVTGLAIALLASACESGNISGERQFDEPIDRVVAKIDASNIHLTATSDSASTVAWDINYAAWKPTMDVWVDGGTLHIDLDCDGDCRGLVDVLVPAHADVTAKTGAGSILLTRITGDLDVEVGSGSVYGREIGARNVIGDTGSGSIELELIDPPSSVDLETGSGSIDLSVPYGTYSIEVSAGSGNTSVYNLVNDPSSAKEIHAHTGSGNVHVEGI